jgi:hypothetical protein
MNKQGLSESLSLPVYYDTRVSHPFDPYVNYYPNGAHLPQKPISLSSRSIHGPSFSTFKDLFGVL